MIVSKKAKVFDNNKKNFIVCKVLSVLCRLEEATVVLPWAKELIMEMLEEMDINKIGRQLNISDWGNIPADSFSPLMSRLTCGYSLANLTTSSPSSSR